MWLAIFLTTLSLGLAWAAARANADGDPASDVLASQPLFLPQDAGIPIQQQAQLAALLRSAARDGYPIRVAVVASRVDLGSVTELWRQPQNYARFLGQELGLVYHGPLLVVMPDGYGATIVSASSAAQPPGLGALPPPGVALGSAALAAAQALAAAAGHRLALPQASAAPSGSGHSTDAVAWAVLAAGAVLILAAWGASLRARPLRLRDRRAPSP